MVLPFVTLERHFPPYYVISKPEGHACVSYMGVESLKGSLLDDWVSTVGSL